MKNKIWLVLFAIAMITLVFAGCSSGNDKDNNAESNHSKQTGNEKLSVKNAPSTKDLKDDDPMTPYIKKGEKLFKETDTALPDNVGNELTCQSCHADGGVSATAVPLVGITTQLPAYQPRSGVPFTTDDRINGCMVRSMNGKMLDKDSEEMKSLVSYLAYISTGIEQGEDLPWRGNTEMKEVPEPDVTAGEEAFKANNCMTCHATDGSGTDHNNGPALWGENSFNDGAGMGRLSKAAGFIQNNMPPNSDKKLSDQEAADLAAFILAQDRPEWKGHKTDWPKGGRPTDIITKDRRDKIKAGTFDWSEIDNVVLKKEK